MLQIPHPRLFFILLLAVCASGQQPNERCHLNKLSADVVFVVDQSTSIGATDFERTRTFLADIVKNITGGDIKNGSVRFAIIAFDTTAITVLNLIDGITTSKVLQAIQSMLQSGGGTSIQVGIMQAKDMLTQQRRSDATPVVVVITDGVDYDTSSSKKNEIKQNVDYIKSVLSGHAFSVAIGDKANKTFHEIVFGQDNAVEIDNFGQLNTMLASKLIGKVCQMVTATQNANAHIVHDDRWFIPFIVAAVLFGLTFLAALIFFCLWLRRRRTQDPYLDAATVHIDASNAAAHPVNSHNHIHTPAPKSYEARGLETQWSHEPSAVPTVILQRQQHPAAENGVHKPRREKPLPHVPTTAQHNAQAQNRYPKIALLPPTPTTINEYQSNPLQDQSQDSEQSAFAEIRINKLNFTDQES